MNTLIMNANHTLKIVLLASAVILLLFTGAAVAADEADFPQMPAKKIEGSLIGTTLTVPGTYQLSGDVLLVKKGLVIDGGTKSSPIVIDLNGHCLAAPQDSTAVTVKKGAYFALKDTSTTITTHYFIADEDGVWHLCGKNDVITNPAPLFFVNGGCIYGGVGEKLNGKTSGGGIWNKGNTTIVSGNIVGCSSDKGAGLYNEIGETRLYGGYIWGNTADNGAGIYIEDGELIFEGGDITYNYAEENGGGIYVNYGKLNMFKGYINENTAAWKGGGIYACQKSTVELKGGKIEDNHADTAGGVYVEKGCKYQKTGTWIEDNTASKMYTDVYSSNAKEVMQKVDEYNEKDNAKDKNYAVTNPGSATPELNVNVDSVYTYYKTLYDAYNAVKSGGKITVLVDTEDKRAVTIKKDITIDLNGKTLFAKAGARDFITVDGGNLIIMDSKSGGAIVSTRKLSNQHTIYLKDGTVTLNSGIISGAEATAKETKGPAIYIDGGSFTMMNGMICNNICDYAGGAVYLTDEGTFFMYGGIICGNEAEYGGGVCLDDKKATFYQYGGTIEDNTAKYGNEIAIFDGTYQKTGGKTASGDNSVWKKN